MSEIMEMPWGEQQHEALLVKKDPPEADALPTTLNRRRYRKALRLHVMPDVKSAHQQQQQDAAVHGGRIPEVLIRPLPTWKRLVDVAGSAMGLILLSPVMLAVAVGIKLTSRGPILFKQVRTGHGGTKFIIYKFRTMVQGAEARKRELAPLNEQDGPVFKITHDPRFTPIGGILRRCSLDELPQLWNVLKGNMSLVGPRPLVCEEANQCVSWQRRRLEVTPGITCIWQARGRCDVSFEQWMLMDLTYIYARSFWVDCLILIQTIPAVLFRRGAR
jgi:lipopolysaccharide/colanic/teichoic acid biosynthesis glycosyltransferase